MIGTDIHINVDLEVLPQAKRDRYIDAILRTVRRLSQLTLDHSPS